LDYQEYLRRIVELTKQVTNPEAGGAYPKMINTPGRRALYDNLDGDQALALAVDAAVRANRQDDWRSNPFKVKKVRNATRAALETAGTQAGYGGGAGQAGVVRERLSVYSTETLEERVERIVALVKNQNEY
jgi:type I restriction enzyme R subunit